MLRNVTGVLRIALSRQLWDGRTVCRGPLGWPISGFSPENCWRSGELRNAQNCERGAQNRSGELTNALKCERGVQTFCMSRSFVCSNFCMLTLFACSAPYLLSVETLCVFRAAVCSDTLCARTRCIFRPFVCSNLLHVQTLCVFRPFVCSDLLYVQTLCMFTHFVCFPKERAVEWSSLTILETVECILLVFCQRCPHCHDIVVLHVFNCLYDWHAG